MSDLLSRLLSVFSPREAMSELRVGELVQATRRTNAEVAPDILRRSEIQFLHCSRARLKTCKFNMSEQEWKTGISSGNT